MNAGFLHDGRRLWLRTLGGFLLTAPTDRPDEWRMDWNNMPFDVSADRFEPIRAEDLAPARADASSAA